MTIGDIEPVTLGACTDLSYVDTGMYDTGGYGAVYVLDAERPAIVETGLGTHHDRVLDALDVLDIARETVSTIAVTHVHLDHAGGAGFLADACPNAEVVVHERGARHLADPRQLAAGTEEIVGDLWPFYTDPVGISEERIRPVADGDGIDLGDHRLDVHYTPGHASHHVVYCDPANETVFTGDAAGVWLPEREEVAATTPPPGFDYEAYHADFETIRDLDPTTLLYSHFGPHSDPENALAAAEAALDAWVEAVTEKRAELEDDAAVIDFFTQRTDKVHAWGEAMARPVAAVDVRGVLHYLDERSS